MPELSDSQLALLDAAEALFARQGFAATTIKAIGAEAGVNPALLYYYFPDKERLYHAVLERRIGAGARHIAGSITPDQPPREALARMLRAYAGMMKQAPFLPRLLARELADHDATHALPLIREIATGLFQRLCDVIRAGQRRGEIRADLEPRFAAVSTIAQVAWFFVAQPAVSRLLGHDGAVPPAETDRYIEHAVQYALAALQPASTPASPTPKRRVSR